MKPSWLARSFLEVDRVHVPVRDRDLFGLELHVDLVHVAVRHRRINLYVAVWPAVRLLELRRDLVHRRLEDLARVRWQIPARLTDFIQNRIPLAGLLRDLEGRL